MHARRAVWPILILAAWLWAQHGPAPRAQIDEDMPAAPGVLTVADAPRTIDELKARIEKVLARDELPGVAIALVGTDGPIWVGGVGVADRESGAPMTADTMFRVGSLSKLVVALGVMRLVDQGKLDIDRPLRDYLPGAVDNPWEDVAPVTLAECMEHTAGLDDVRFNEVYTDDDFLPVADALAKNPRSRRVRWQPGTRHAYSNVGFTIAARAIEAVTGEPFDAYLRREVLAPMGITDASYGRTPTAAARLATGYFRGGPATFFPFAHRPSGALLASAADLGKLAQFWLRRGAGYPPIVSPAGLARIEHSGTLPYGHLDTEYGFANYGDVSHPARSRGHDGGMPGFHSSIRYFPSLGVGYVMLLNSDYTFRGYFELRSLLYAFLTQGKPVAPEELAAPPSEPPAADYFRIGAPRSAFFGFFDRVLEGFVADRTGERVQVTTLRGQTWTLVPAGDGAYRGPRESGSSVRFTRAADGTPIMLTSWMYAEAGGPAWIAQLRFIGLTLAVILWSFAPLWTVVVLGYSVIARRRVLPASHVLLPAIAGLCLNAWPKLLDASFLAGVIGVKHPLTVALCAVTIGFAVASTVLAASVLRWSVRPDRPSLTWRAVPIICAVAFLVMTVWLTANGWVGMRTWAW